MSQSSAQPPVSASVSVNSSANTNTNRTENNCDRILGGLIVDCPNGYGILEGKVPQNETPKPSETPPQETEKK